MPKPSRRHLVFNFVLGVATGLLVGILLVVSPVLAVVIVGIVLVGTAVSIGRRGDPSRGLSLAGTLVGAGILFLLGTANTIRACSDTADFCGNTNVLPLGALALVTIGIGAIASAVVAVRGVE